VKGEGRVVGPDLSSYATKPPQDIVVAVIDPNQAIAGGFAGYLVETRDGRDLSGVIAAETPTSITLRIAGGQEEVLLRSDLSSLRSSGLSLMPEGLEKTLRPQDLADLIAFIRK
jgi:putative heme-binding domain-containing protein